VTKREKGTRSQTMVENKPHRLTSGDKYMNFMHM